MELSRERVERLLASGEIEVLGHLPGASNDTLAVTVIDSRARTVAVYKPRDGETPLWDFPDGTLYKREIAAYRLSLALGWPLIPPTIERDGPLGIGSLQLFIDADRSRHYLSMMPDHADEFRAIAAFDLVVNNADRKSGHCLLERASERVWAVDHGVCFNVDPKLRTVMWDFIGEPIPPPVLDSLRALTPERAREVLAGLLDDDEVDAVAARAALVVTSAVFPPPEEGRRPYPWPPI